MPIFSPRIKRWILLKLLARQTPAKLQQLSQKRLQRTYASAVAHSSAYRTLLEEAGSGGNSRLSADQILQSAPVLQKADLFERFPMSELVSTHIKPAELAGILTSSGYGGGNFALGVSTRIQMQLTPDDIDMGLQQAFGIDSRSTLLVNCLPMGVMFTSNAVCVANVSVREDMALAILRQAGPLFEQVILCVDPLFCKRLLDYAAEQAFDWGKLRINVIIGEEMFSEDFRTYLASHLKVDMSAPGSALIGSSMGVGELGLNLFFETAETIALRRSLHEQERDQLLPAFFCFNPLRTLVEVLAPGADGVGDLVVTMLDEDAPIPMIRYRTGDRARWVTDADMEQLGPETRAALARQPFPMIAIFGRDRDRIDSHWHVDHFKALLYRRPALAEQFSGAFVAVGEPSGLKLDVQLARHCTRESSQVAAELLELITDSAQRRSVPVPRVNCYAYTAFPHGMGLDYERKFRYFPSA